MNNKKLFKMGYCNYTIDTFKEYISDVNDDSTVLVMEKKSCYLSRRCNYPIYVRILSLDAYRNHFEDNNNNSIINKNLFDDYDENTKLFLDKIKRYFVDMKKDEEY